MKPQQILNWQSSEILRTFQNQEIESWLLEKGPITERIRSCSSFKLEVLKDEFASIDSINDDLIIKNFPTNKVREVKLFADDNEFVFARSIIPQETIHQGLSLLGNIKDKPLGDIIFSEPNISREIFLYAKFQYQHQEIWGRKIIYTVNNYPFSIAEVFIIPE